MRHEPDLESILVPNTNAVKVERERRAHLRRLVFSAKERCSCGAGFAYLRWKSSRVWDCSAILLGDALLEGESGTCHHSAPCTYFEIVSERQPAAHGHTTRPAA